MDQFSISDLARLSGVKPFTIRFWEKRYKALRPNRSPGNSRFYSNHQLIAFPRVQGGYLVAVSSGYPRLFCKDRANCRSRKATLLRFENVQTFALRRDGLRPGRTACTIPAAIGDILLIASRLRFSFSDLPDHTEPV